MAFYKIADAAKKTGVHPSSIYNYVAKGEIPHKVIDGTKQVQLGDVRKIKPRINSVGKHKRPNYGSHMVERNGKRLATPKKAARILGIDMSTIYSYIRKGKVEAIHIPESPFKFVDIDEVKAVLEGNDSPQKQIVFVRPKTDQRHSRHGATTTTQRVEDLELLYYELLQKVEGHSKALQNRAEARDLMYKRIVALEERLEQLPAPAEPAIDWSAIPRGTRVVHDELGGGVYIGQDGEWTLVLLDRFTDVSKVNEAALKLEEND